MQTPRLTLAPPDVPRHTAAGREDDRYLFLALFVLGCVSVVAAVAMGTSVGFAVVLVALALLVFGVLLLRWPILGFYAVAVAAVMVDEGTLGSNADIHMPDIYVFYWPPALEGFIERPIGVLVLFVLATLILRRFALRQRILAGGGLIVPFALFILVVALGFAHGLATGGSLKVAVVAVRPLWYIFISYVLAYNLVSRREQVRVLLWVLVIGVGLRALLGLWILLAFYHGQLSRDGRLIGHEDSYFFACFFLVIILLALLGHYRPQLYASLAITPLVLIALVANQRRADYVALALGIAVVWALVVAVRPRARARLVVIGLMCVFLGAGYVMAFAGSTSAIGEPARGVVSVFQPSVEADRADSNLYREMENYDLIYTAKQSPLLGTGFGVPFQQPKPLTSIYPGIQSDDPYYNYVPHNNIYWILVSTGLVGFFALWYLFGSMIVRGSLIARRLRDPYLRMFAIFVVASVFMEVTVAYADYQLFFFRNVFFVGLLAGTLMRLPELDQQAPETQAGKPV